MLEFQWLAHTTYYVAISPLQARIPNDEKVCEENGSLSCIILYYI